MALKGVFDGVLQDEKQLVEACSWSMISLSAEPMFCYLVLYDYKEKPTSAKARAIADTFTTADTPLSVNTDDDAMFLPRDKTLASALGALSTLSANFAKAKNEEEKFLVVEWALITDNFTKPSKVFDRHLAKVGTSLGDVLGRYKRADPKVRTAAVAGTGLDSTAKGFITKTWEPARKVLEKAGLDVKKFTITPK
jgi:hypothetical protein